MGEEVDVRRANNAGVAGSGRCRDGATLSEEVTPYATRARWRPEPLALSLMLETVVDRGSVSVGREGEERASGETANGADSELPARLFEPIFARSSETGKEKKRKMKKA